MLPPPISGISEPRTERQQATVIAPCCHLTPAKKLQIHDVSDTHASALCGDDTVGHNMPTVWQVHPHTMHLKEPTAPGVSARAAAAVQRHPTPTTIVQATVTVLDDVRAVFFVPEHEAHAAQVPIGSMTDIRFAAYHKGDYPTGRYHTVPCLPVGLISLSSPEAYADTEFLHGTSRYKESDCYQPSRPVRPTMDPHSLERVTDMLAELARQLPFPIALENYTLLPMIHPTPVKEILHCAAEKMATGAQQGPVTSRRNQCTTNAHILATRIAAEGITPLKVFVHAQTGFTGEPPEGWKFHVVVGAQGSDGVWLLEPLLGNEPITLLAWLTHLNPTHAPLSLDITSAEQHYPIRMSGFDWA